MQSLSSKSGVYLEFVERKQPRNCWEPTGFYQVPLGRFESIDFSVVSLTVFGEVVAESENLSLGDLATQ